MPPPPPPSTPPPGQGWQSQPQQPGPPPPMGGGPMGGGMPSWTSNITARGTMAGPGGLALADNVDRIIAWIIDAIIVGIVGYIVTTITTSILGDNFLAIFGIGTYKVPSLISALLAVVVMLAATAGYFVYMWTRMGGATIGMRVMKLSVRDASSGAPISQNQALYRWAFLAAPLAIYWGLYGYGFLSLLAALVLLGWEIYLIYTVANSPTRQGFHDQYAKTVVAKVM
jgi:uncharacterized RDD family membrane protein YckC